MEWPDDLPKSPTGRVPQWVIDEAAGKTTTPDPWRASSAPLEFAWESPKPTRARANWKQTAITIAVLLCLAAAPRVLSAGFAQKILPLPSTPPPVVATAGSDGSVGLVAADEAWPTPDVGTSSERLLPAVPVTSGNYALMDVGSDGMPGARWSPCRAISVVVNTSGAPKGFYAAAVSVVAEVQQLTGLAISVEGASAEAASKDRASFQPKSYGDRWAPVLIAWANAKRIPALQGDTIGIGSPYSVSVNDGPYFYVSGAVTLDLEMAHDSMPDGTPMYVSVLRHELAHVLGLDHVDDPTQIMAPRSGDVSDFADGDRAGLALLGSGPCSTGI